MGRFNSQPENDSMIKHFSHPHPLHLFNPQLNQTLNLAPCSGCKLQLSGSIYSCTACNYHLHLKCSQAPHQITHPFHKNHILSLLPTPSYPNGFFNCDACGKQGNGFSYHCKACEIDLHSTCASMPMLLTHPAHCHQVSLVFSPPYPNKSFSCDICKNIGSNHWLYRCNLCGFDAHLACTMINRQAQQENQPNMPQTSPMTPTVMGIPSGTMPGLQNYANQSGNRTVQDQQMIIVQLLQNMRNSALQYTNQSISQALLGGGAGAGVSAGGNPYLQALSGAGRRNDMLNTMMGGSVGNPLLQGLMGGSGGGSDILNAMMGGGGGGDNIMQQLAGGGDVGSLLQGMMGGGNASVLDLLGGAGGGSDLSGLAGALGGLGGFGF